MAGTLVLVATPLGNMGDLSPRAVEALAAADCVACEDTRHTGRLLELAGIRARRLAAVHGHNEASMVGAILARLEVGETVALVSDAGMPGISDPGQRLVRAAADAGYKVTVVPGPSAGVSALAISGMPTDRWVFEGFLPRKGVDRTARLVQLGAEARTVVVYESPHRLAATLADLVRACGAERRVVVVRELTKLHEEVWRGTVAGALAAVEARQGGPRGEYVLVLEGAPPPPPPDEGAIEAALAGELTGGADAKAAVARVARALGVPKHEVYDVAVRLRRHRG